MLVSAALSQSVSPKAVNDVKHTAGVGATTAVRTLPTVKLMQANEQFTAMAVDRELLDAMYPATHQEGDAAQAIEHGEIAVGRKVADSNGYAIGSTVEMESKNIGIDEAATKQAIAAYEQQVGTSNGQVRGMIAIESVILSVFGTVLGILVGLGAGVVVRQAYRDNGLSTMSIPWLQLLGFLGAAILVGLIASISPASRALKKPVLEAVASD